MVDMSYYKGKVYLYFGVTPALVLYWPYVAVTGHYLSDKAAVTIFFISGFLIAAALLRDLWRRYLSNVSGGYGCRRDVYAGFCADVNALVPF
jgi:hypothetical protein